MTRIPCNYFGVTTLMRAPLLAFALVTVAFGQVAAAQQLVGHVYGGGGPVAESTVTLWAAGQGAPTKLSETKAREDGAFDLTFDTQRAGGDVLYLIARGGTPKVGGSQGANPAITLMATLGANPPKEVTINELTTVASVWTGAQFLKGETFSGHALGLKIAAGNVPNLVDLAAGGLGPVIQDPMNSTQTTTL